MERIDGLDGRSAPLNIIEPSLQLTNRTQPPPDLIGPKNSNATFTMNVRGSMGDIQEKMDETQDLVTATIRREEAEDLGNRPESRHTT